MSAPEVPKIHVAQNGGRVRVRWQGVTGATYYNVYLGEGRDPTTVEDVVLLAAEEAPWFTWWSDSYAGSVFVRVTALNALDEESDYSNQKCVTVTSGSDGQDSFHYTDALAQPAWETTHAKDVHRF